jgi:uncharacterized membrane protein YgdD (TMEM256/DUF423 family)
VSQRWIALGAAWAGLGVVLGAFGAHALKERLDPAALEIWHTGVLYHLLHALALVLHGLFQERGGSKPWPAWLFLLGSAVFSLSLYGLALGGPRWLGAITPAGGLALIAGWCGFAAQAWSRARC